MAYQMTNYGAAPLLSHTLDRSQGADPRLAQKKAAEVLAAANKRYPKDIARRTAYLVSAQQQFEAKSLPVYHSAAELVGREITRLQGMQSRMAALKAHTAAQSRPPLRRPGRGLRPLTALPSPGAPSALPAASSNYTGSSVAPTDTVVSVEEAAATDPEVAAALATQAAELTAAVESQVAADEAIAASGQDPVAGATVQKGGFFSNPIVLIGGGLLALYALRGFLK